MAEQEYLTRQEVVTITILSITTVGCLIRLGQLPARHVGWRVLIPRQACQERLQAQPPQGERR
jgi:hypothetical protein